MTVAEGKDDKNKSQIPTGDDYGEKKDIPAGRPGAETDMAQTALFIACNQYLYGQVSSHCDTVANNLLTLPGRLSPSTVDTS